MFLDDLVVISSRALKRYPEAQAYLAGRLITGEDIEKYRIGYWKTIGVPNDGTEDRERFMEEAWKGRRYEGMIIFPILDALGRAVGIIGRSISSKLFNTFLLEEARYNGFFFGFYQALPDIYERNKAYVVEGAPDTIALSKVIPNTVGASTAGLYENQYEYLKLFCDEIVTVFDSDEAGREAADKAVKFLKGVSKMDLGYHDPDNCLKTLGLQGFHKHVKNKMNKLSFLGG